MAKVLDVKFYCSERIDHPLIKKTTEFRGVFANHIRISDESEVTDEMISLLRKGYDFK